jgi:pimeloyl-ACP methyl ester carboxylesterase
LKRKMPQVYAPADGRPRTPGMDAAKDRSRGGRIPGARLEVIEGADHLPNMRKPGDFNRLVLGFRDDLGKQPANGP